MLTQVNLVPQNGEEFELIFLVETLLKEKLISPTTYRLFLNEEKNYGSIHGKITDGIFRFTHVGLSNFIKGAVPQTPEDEMYIILCNAINRFIQST